MKTEAGSVGQGGSATSLSLIAVVMVYGCMDREAVPLAYPHVELDVVLSSMWVH